MNRVLLAIFVLLACNQVAAEESDFRCLKSTGSKKPIRLQFTFPAGTSDEGYVNYQGGSERITVRRMKEKELERVPGGRPSVFESRWVEAAPNGSGGTYVLATQGAVLDEFRYIRKKDGKIFRFEEDLDATGEDSCEWKKK